MALMRAWKLDSTDDPLRLAEVPDPAPRPGGAVVEVLAVHVPAYTGAVASGPRGFVPTPLVLGVGGVGRVEAVADDVVGLAPGDVVVNTSLLSSGDAAEPEEILVGWTGIGGRGRRTGAVESMQARWRDGTFAERALLPAQVLLRLPGADAAGIAPERLAFLPWLAIAGEALEVAGQDAGDVVVIPGATGQLGAAAVLVALARGAARVVAVGRNTDALARLRAIDPRVVTVALTGDREPDAAAVTAAGGVADVVVDVLGSTPTADATMAGYDVLRDGGSWVLVGGVRQDLPIPYGDFMHRRLTLRGSWMSRPATVLALWRMIVAGVLRLDALEAVVVGLDDPSSALALAAATSGPAYVVLVPSVRAVPTPG